MAMNIYTTKKVKKPRDPNLPPPENLFSHGKKIRDINAVIDEMKDIINRQAAESAELRSKIRQLEYRVDLLTNLVRRNSK